MKARTCTRVQIHRTTGHDGAVATVRAQNSPCPIHVPTEDAHIDSNGFRFIEHAAMTVQWRRRGLEIRPVQYM